MIWLIMMLMTSSPIMAGLLLLMTSIMLILSWNMSLYMYLVALVYISGLLVLLLYLTTFMSNLSQLSSKLWILLLIVFSSFSLLQPFTENVFSMQMIYSHDLMYNTICILLLLVMMMLLLAHFVSMKLNIRHLN